jgi:predicted DNA binding CopG/RHH family protein
MTKKQIDLEEQEADILKEFEAGHFVSVKNRKQEMALAKEAAHHFIRRDARVNLRVSNADLNMIRRIAIQEGLPYQTLLASIIHKFAAGRLVDKGSLA